MKLILEGNPISTGSLYRRNSFVMYMTKEGKALKENYAWQAKTQWRKGVITGPVTIEVRLFFKGIRRRDIDNFHKILLDSLTGIVWEDDSQIMVMRVEKHRDDNNPRIELTVIV